MKKLQYIQPKVEMMLTPEDALMDAIALAGSPTGPSLSPSRIPERKPEEG